MRNKTKDTAMTPTSRWRAGAVLLAGTLALAAQVWSPSLIGDGFSPTDAPNIAYFRGEVAPPSWQGRPSEVPEIGRLASRENFRREML
jgi:hypothetical protein